MAPTPPARLRLTPVARALIVVILLLLGLGIVVLRQAGQDDGPAATTGLPTTGLPTTGLPITGSDVPADPSAVAVTPGQASPTPLGVPSPPEGPVADASSMPIPQPTDLADSAGAVLPAGTCLTDTSQPTTVASVTPISCDAEHTGEVFISVVLTQPDGTPYPGQEALEEDSRFLCQGPAFESYVGLPYAGEPSSRFFVYPLVPTEMSWAEGDRDISCVLYDVAAPMVGSQRGSNR